MKYSYAALVLCLVIGGCASQPQNSGYLSTQEYSLISKAEMPSGQQVYRYVTDDFNANNYHHVIAEPVQIHPKPQATQNVSLKTLNTLQEKMSWLVKNRLSKVVPLTNTAGKGVMRVEAAITGVHVSAKDLAVYEYIPIALVAASVSTASGIRDQQVKLYLEGKVTDSVTGKLLAVSVREIPGEALAGAKSKLEIQQLNKGLADAGNDLTLSLQQLFNR